jgi:hypothetical protein
MAKTSKKNKQCYPQHQKPDIFPYGFVRRAGGKHALEAMHDRLKTGRYDIAFEVNWKLLSPTALNPCNDINVPPNMPATDSASDFAGYDKRWLMIQNRPAISPFTVKSAVANGFANLLGGCYRVITKVEVHKNLEEGNYPYNGAWKRYRVDMANSKAGVLTKIEVQSDGSRRVTILPLKEFLYDQKPDKPFDPRVPYRFIAGDRGSHLPPVLTTVTEATKDDENVVYYHGPYGFGMNAGLKAGNLRKNHRHRFYKRNGEAVSGILRAENFINTEKLKHLVYVGQLKHGEIGNDPRPEGGPWYEDLSGLQPGDWVY